MPIYNAYTNTNDYPYYTDYPMLKELGLTMNIRDPRFAIKTVYDQWTDQRVKYINDQQAWLRKYGIDVNVYNAWVKANQKPSEDEKTFLERMKNTFTQVFQSTQNTVNIVSNKISSAIAIVRDKVGQISFETLAPLKPAMVAALKRKGFTNVSDSDSTKSVAVRFYSSYMNNKNSLESIEVTPDEVNAAIQTAQGVAPLIQAIISLFDQLKGKKDAGATLSPEQQKLVSDAEKSIEENKAKTETGNKKIFVVLGILAGLFVVGKLAKWF
jgi:hypothetical protein